jgi:hypothetical protein
VNNNHHHTKCALTITTKSWEPKRQLRRRRRQHGPLKMKCILTVVLATACSCILLTMVGLFIMMVIHYWMKVSQPSSNEHNNDLLANYIYRGATNGGWRPILSSDLRLSTLQCNNTISNDINMNDLQEMVYWQKITSDHLYISPFYDPYESSQRYIIFDIDVDGDTYKKDDINQIRLTYETILTMAYAMGRTLVISPLSSTDNNDHQNIDVMDNIYNIIPLQYISDTYSGITIITMKEFLLKEAIVGNVYDRSTGHKSFPPYNFTNYHDVKQKDTIVPPTNALHNWLHQVSYIAHDWNMDECLISFPISRDPDDAISLELRFANTRIDNSNYNQYIGHPTPVYSGAYDRLSEMINQHTKLCIYNNTLVHEPILYFSNRKHMATSNRIMDRKAVAATSFHWAIPFYTILYFENWKHDVWTKRFVRDTMRYDDTIQCIAGQIVFTIRERASQLNRTNDEGLYDAIHIVKEEQQNYINNDYAYQQSIANDIYTSTNDIISDGTIVYVTMKELNENTELIRHLSKHYSIVSLNDFSDLLLLHQYNSNNNIHMDMIDQLVASRSNNFFGYWSSPYVLRI